MLKVFVKNKHGIGKSKHFYGQMSVDVSKMKPGEVLEKNCSLCGNPSSSEKVGGRIRIIVKLTASISTPSFEEEDEEILKRLSLEEEEPRDEEESVEEEDKVSEELPGRMRSASMPPFTSVELFNQVPPILELEMDCSGNKGEQKSGSESVEVAPTNTMDRPPPVPQKPKLLLRGKSPEKKRNSVTSDSTTMHMLQHPDEVQREIQKQIIERQQNQIYELTKMITKLSSKEKTEKVEIPPINSPDPEEDEKYNFLTHFSAEFEFGLIFFVGTMQSV